MLMAIERPWRGYKWDLIMCWSKKHVDADITVLGVSVRWEIHIDVDESRDMYMRPADLEGIEKKKVEQFHTNESLLHLHQTQNMISSINYDQSTRCKTSRAFSICVPEINSSEEWLWKLEAHTSQTKIKLPVTGVKSIMGSQNWLLL